MELPFVVGIMADLSGPDQAKDPNRVPLRDRNYVEIDRDNFNDIMRSIGPEVALNGDGTLKFEELADFSPIKVLGRTRSDGTRQQIAAKADFDTRTRLSDMIAKLDGNVTLQKGLLDYLTSDVERPKLKQALETLRGLLPPDKNDDAPPIVPEKKKEVTEDA
jgi:type VI secretion system protein ImpB